LSKLITGLTAIVLSIVFVMSPNASAEEPGTEDQTTETVDCTMRVIEPDFSHEDGTYDVGTPITLELYVPKGGEMEWFFVASRDGGAEYRLNDVSRQSIGWTPVEAGAYTVRGEFIDPEGNVLPIENPSMCMVTLTVDAAEVDTEPTNPYQGACGEPDTLTLVPIGDGFYDVYNSDNQLCSTIGGQEAQAILSAQAPVEQPAPAVTIKQAELPRTGNGTAKLMILGAILVFVGRGVEWGGKKLAAR
jgi:hypothetical protein